MIACLLGVGLTAGSSEVGERYAESRRAFFISQTFEPNWQTLQTHDANVRLNVMLKKWGRLSLGQRFGFSDAHNDASLRLAPGRGIAGLALEIQQWVIGIRIDETAIGAPTDRCYVLSEAGRVLTKDGTPVRDIAHGLTPRQRRDTDRLRLIISYPFKGLRTENGSVRTTGDVEGVINIDSSNISPYVIRDPASGEVQDLTPLGRQVIDELLPRLAVVAGWVFG